MKKKTMLLTTMLLLFAGMAHAQVTAYTYVKQNGSYVSADGTAAFDVSSTPAVMKFDDDDNAIMTIGDVTVAKIRANERNIDLETGLAAGVLAADFDNQSGSTNLTLTVSASDTPEEGKTATMGYLTVYSPFQLQMPASTVKAYASTYDSENKVLKCNSTTQVGASVILPVCTSLILMNAGKITFTMSQTSSSSISEDIEGYAVKMPRPTVESGKKIYTLGHASQDKTKFGFYIYSESQKTLAAGKAYLVASNLDEARPGESSSTAKYIAFDFSEDATSINNANTGINAIRNGKFLDNGRVVIVKNGQKFNLTGQEVK